MTWNDFAAAEYWPGDFERAEWRRAFALVRLVGERSRRAHGDFALAALQSAVLWTWGGA